MDLTRLLKRTAVLAGIKNRIEKQLFLNKRDFTLTSY